MIIFKLNLVLQGYNYLTIYIVFYLQMFSRKSHNAKVRDRHLQDSQQIKIRNGGDIPLQAV